MRLASTLALILALLASAAPARAAGAVTEVGRYVIHHGLMRKVVPLPGSSTQVLSIDAWGGVRLWDAATGGVAWSYGGDVEPALPSHPASPYAHDLFAAAFAPSRLVAAIGGVDRLEIVDVVQGTRLRAFELPPSPSGAKASTHLVEVAFSPDGRLLAAHDAAQNRVLLFDVASGATLHVLSYVSLGAARLSFSDDGDLLYAAGLLGNVRIWDVPTGTIRRDVDLLALDLGGGLPSGTALSQDWRFLAVAIATSIVILDIETFSIVSRLRFVGNPAAIAFSADQSQLVAVERAGTVTTWDIASGAVLAQSTQTLAVMSHHYAIYGYSLGVLGDMLTIVSPLANRRTDSSVTVWKVALDVR